MPEGKVAKNTAYLLTAFVGQKVLAFVYFTIVARWVGVEGSGRYFVALSFTTIFSIFVDLGLSNVLVREVAKVPDEAKKLLSNVLGIKVVLSVLTVAAVFVTARLLRFPEQTRLMIGIASVVMVLDSIHLVFYAVMRGFQNLRYEAVGMISGQAVIITAGLIFIFSGLPLPFLVVALICGSTWNVLWSGTRLVKYYGIRPRLSLDPAVARFYWQVTVPFALAGIFSRVYSYIDSVMLSRMVSETAVGFYGAAYKITFAFQFLPMGLAAAVYPAMSGYYVSDRGRLGRVLVTSLRYLMLAVLPLTTGIFVLASPVIRLVYGPAFAGSVAPLQILIFSLIPAFLYWPAGSLLNACDRQAKNTMVMGLTMVSNVFLNIFLLPRYGAVGAASAALVSNSILFGSAYYYASRVTAIDHRSLLRSAARIVLSAGVMALAVQLVKGAAGVFVSIPLGVMVYAGVLWSVRGITWAETKSLIDIFLRRGRGVSDIIA